MRVASLFLAVALAVQAQTVTLDQRRQAFQYVLTQLPQLHPNFFSITPRTTFETAGRELDTSVPFISVEEFYTRLAGLVAMGRDAHTVLGVTSSGASSVGFTTLPVLFREFDDGIFVT